MNTNKYGNINIKKKNNYRVPVLYPDGKPGMPTSNKRANKWLEECKAEIVKNKLNIFAIKLKFWPVYRENQPIALLIDPGSTFTGIAVMSKRCINISYMLELPGYKRGSKPFIVEKKLKRVGKNNGKIVKIEKWTNTIVDRMTERRMLRRGRRHRKCRRRECRFLNRSKKGKLAPSMLAKKQLELEAVKELVKLYPISWDINHNGIIGFEDVSYNHYKDVDGIRGAPFSQVEIGKNWILKRLRKITNLRMIKGYETSSRRELLKLPKEKDKTARKKSSHVTDCIAMGSIVFGILYKSNIPGNKFHFNVLSRPKYNRRSLFAYEPSKRGIFERAGGHIHHTDTFKGLRKGDYVECKAPLLKKIYRGWISGYTDDRIYISDFDWRQSPSFSVDNIRLLDRNHGLINLRLSWTKCFEDICEFGSKQIDSEGMKVNRKMVDKMIKDKKKAEKDAIKESNKQFEMVTVQRSIEDAWG